jgi:hypothetical protein
VTPANSALIALQAKCTNCRLLNGLDELTGCRATSHLAQNA